MDPEVRSYAVRHALIALTIMIPVTLPVAGFRDFVQAHFEVSDLAASLFMVVNMVAGMLAAPLVGGLVDRFGYRRAWILGALVVDCACFLAMWYARSSFSVFLSLRALEGAAHITALSLVLSLAADHASAAQRGRAMGLVAAALTLGVAIGAPVGGVLARTDPWFPLIVASGMLAAAGFACAFALRRPPKRQRSPRMSTVLKAVFERARGAWIPLLFTFADRFTVGFFTTTFVLYLRNVYGVGRGEVGLLLALFLLPFSILSWPCGRASEQVSRARLMLVGSFVYGVLVASLGAWSVDGLRILMPLLGVSAAVMYVPSLLLLLDLGPPRARSTLMAAFNATGSLGFILGPIVGGLVVDVSGDPIDGYRRAFLVAGLAQVLCVAFTARSLLRLRADGRTT